MEPIVMSFNCGSARGSGRAHALPRAHKNQPTKQHCTCDRCPPRNMQPADPAPRAALPRACALLRSNQSTARRNSRVMVVSDTVRLSVPMDTEILAASMRFSACVPRLRSAGIVL